MLLEKDKYCKCPNCTCKSFKDVSIVNVVVTKNEWNDDILVPVHETSRYKCTRCGKEFSADEIYEYYKKE